MHYAGTQRDPGRHDSSEITSSGLEHKRSGMTSQRKRKSSRESKKLQRDPEKRRTYSFSPGRNDSIRAPRDTHRQYPVPPLLKNINSKGNSGPGSEKPEGVIAAKQPLQASTQPAMGALDWQRVPTLHKRSAQDLPRRKSSKKRKEEHDREAEIKAMVPIMPTRPATDSSMSGRPMKRESRKMHGGLNRHLQNPSSDISLPTTESIQSSLSSKSDQHTSYKLSAFDVLAPRPTIRCSEYPRYAPGASGFGSDQSDSRRRRISERPPIPEETLKANKRIDDLADDLDAGDLRELMERDQRRREKKKLSDNLKMEKRLARRQEKQRADEATAAEKGTVLPGNMERGVLGREVVGLGIGTSAVVTSSKRKKGLDASETTGGKRSADAFQEDSTTSTHNPFNNFHRSASVGTELPTPKSVHEEPVIEIAQATTISRANISSPSSPRGHVRGASSISQMVDRAKAQIPAQEKPEPVRQSSESSTRQPQSWTSFFKRGPRSKRGSTPSSFSNTSRDSMQNGQPLQIGYTPVRQASNTPKRTMSRFREDLPELPISPPDSRVQSPEADIVPPIRTDYLDKRTSHRGSSDNPFADPRIRYDTPTSGYRSLDAVRLRDETPTSGHRSMDAPSPEPSAVLSQSLASIDSEASWLSGRKGGSKRGSAQLPSLPLRDSASSLTKRYKGFSESTEELGIAQDEYFSRLTPGPENQFKIQRQSSAGNSVSSSDEEDGDSLASPSPSGQTKWGAVGRQPTVVHHQTRAKSREGLLNDYENDSGSEPLGETPIDLNRKSYRYNQSALKEDVGSGVHRALSVDLGRGHVRHISAGSARLLELKPRASEESKRLSSG